MLYGNFNKLCEDFINSDINIRETVKEFLQNDKCNVVENKVLPVSILLIDEVDVFFSKDFYGECYTPSA